MNTNINATVEGNMDENKLKQSFGPETYHILRFKVGYVGGKTNPLNKVTFYNLKNVDSCC